ncbi:glutathione S-transferase family protein [Sphingomonas sp. M1-B02]|uniref:glutathione S-transferase family protein n=1 Tax=Sphingomonas sp. M1-B02 TaxID=3114300 RepID=UPI002240D957|nr:glutathione S-transferase family protein [Sphingomonas sp. S6-11]UZK67112.1 glutathione S-transferase family protein [Sphingomonas sp. S6-11]
MLQLFAHPFSSYCQKVLIALYENHTVFELRMLDGAHEANCAELAARWPLRKFPILVDGDRTILETSTIIEHLQLHHPGARPMIPADPDAAIDVRMMDRIFDNYVMHAMQGPVFDSLRPEADRYPRAMADAVAALDTVYAWLDARMAGREWAAGAFSLADCAAAPSLFYADWVHPIAEQWTNLIAYRARLLSRPSVARAVDEGRPYRHFFPLGAPDRD